MSEGNIGENSLVGKKIAQNSSSADRREEHQEQGITSELIQVAITSGHLTYINKEKNFPVCTRCSKGRCSTPDHILESLGHDKEDLLEGPLLVIDFLMSVRCNGPSLDLLGNRNQQQQQL